MAGAMYFIMYLLQGKLNDTIVLQLFDDATPEDKDEYKVFLSNIQTFGNTTALSANMVDNHALAYDLMHLKYLKITLIRILTQIGIFLIQALL